MLFTSSDDVTGKSFDAREKIEGWKKSECLADVSVKGLEGISRWVSLGGEQQPLPKSEIWIVTPHTPERWDPIPQILDKGPAGWGMRRVEDGSQDGED